MLPLMNGYDVLKYMRAQKVWSPVLMLTAKDGEYDQTDAFELGADDYVTKPFSTPVLLARLQALARRGAPERPVPSPWAASAWTPPPAGSPARAARSS